MEGIGITLAEAGNVADLSDVMHSQPTQARRNYDITTTHCFGVWGVNRIGWEMDGQARPNFAEPFYPQNTLVIGASADYSLEGLR